MTPCEKWLPRRITAVRLRRGSRGPVGNVSGSVISVALTLIRVGFLSGAEIDPIGVLAGFLGGFVCFDGEGGIGDGGDLSWLLHGRILGDAGERRVGCGDGTARFGWLCWN